MNRPAADHEALNIATARVTRRLVQALWQDGTLRTADAKDMLGTLDRALEPFNAVTVIASGSETIVEETANGP